MFAKIIICLAAICAFLDTSHCELFDQDECPHICSDNSDPICVTDGKNYLEFTNHCEFKSNKCNSPKDSLKNYSPTVLGMCRTEMVTSLDKLLTRLGDLDLTKSGCLKPCASIHKPICISNGKLRFPAANRCIMDTINCGLSDDKEPFEILKNGSC